MKLSRLAKTTQGYDIPVVAPGELLGQTTGANSAVSSVGLSLHFRGQVLAQYAAQKLKVESVAVLSDSRSEASSSLVTAFNTELKSRGIRVEEHSFQSEADIASVVPQALWAKPGAVLIAGTAADLPKLR